MNFEEILANCLDALERGETIESCLARYPAQATELAPLLHIATTVRSTPRPRMSAQAFQRGREAVQAQARHQHSLHQPFAASAKPTPRPSAMHSPVVISKPRLRQPLLQKPFVFLQRTTGVFVALVLCLGMLSLTRHIITSLPGNILYPVKILCENMEGVLLTAAGEQVTWRARQTENRLQELVMLTQQEQTATADLVQNIDANLQATLVASNQLPLAQRNQFLQAWVERLQSIKKDKQLPPTVTLTLEKAITTVRSATQVTSAPVFARTEVAPTETEQTERPARIFTPILVPTRIPDEATPFLAQQAPVQVTVDATTAPIAIEITPMPLATDTAEAPVVIEPTAAMVVIEVPKLSPPSSNEAQQPHQHRASQAAPEPTTAPVVVDVATQTTNAVTVNSAFANNNVKASRAVTTSVDTGLNPATDTNNNNLTSTAVAPTVTTAVATPTALMNPTALATPEYNDTPTADGSSTSTSIPATAQPSTPIESKSTAVSTQTPEPSASAPISNKHNTPTATPKKTTAPDKDKTVEPTAPPTETPQPTNPQPTSPPPPTATQAADNASPEDTPTSQPTPASTATASNGDHKQPGKK